jgi:hypothetical protein
MKETGAVGKGVGLGYLVMQHARPVRRPAIAGSRLPHIKYLEGKPKGQTISGDGAESHGSS